MWQPGWCLCSGVRKRSGLKRSSKAEASQRVTTRPRSRASTLGGEKAARKDSTSVILFCLPWAEPWHAPLGLSIVANKLDLLDIDYEIVHGNTDLYVRLKKRLGALANKVFEDGRVGELICSELLSGPDSVGSSDEVVIRQRLLREVGITRKQASVVVEELQDFFDDCFARFDLSQTLVCGFGLGIHQTVPSLVLGSRIKSRWPQVKIVFGGSQCSDPMGIALLEAYPWIDVVARGECDDSLGPLFSALITGSTLQDIPNVAWRSGSEIHLGPIKAVSAQAMGSPNYATYENSYEKISPNERPANFYVEASRGCWWGQKHHCTFCGIHANGLNFRSKNVDRVVDEIETLIQKHKTVRIAFSDTILGIDHLRDLLPHLQQIRSRFDVEFLADVKPNLSKQQIYALANAGFIAVQLGIESFSDRLLQRMRKGNRALQHVQTLKWFAEAGIGVHYNILTHVPDETASDYYEALALVRNVPHIHPPSGVFPIELNRYSPYFENWSNYGFEKPAPSTFYEGIFRKGEIDLDQFAYSFKGYHPSTKDSLIETARQNFISFVETNWTAGYPQSNFFYWLGPNRVFLAREGNSPLHKVLEGYSARIFLECDKVQSIERLLENADESDRRTRREEIERLVEEGILIQSADETHVLAVALRRLALRPAHIASWG
ncbi:MAG: RiPP maturation radical SAM protein 1 [Bradyrhizobium sp.]|uniref:RiPP maturation radical SAM C-methyltransferase n=1 Tax=Bradyrhizobium sp. TaxID=376 RepID=UPI00122AB7DC|nr:RiPP maturation radical SAM C-methyltransferase [Bradyrhizobium sp.]THD62548.1 MAG: RiPP maturation radical SAM protein 1 [Bradyrhizobium sp.]